jgi:hypothetical protein
MSTLRLDAHDLLVCLVIRFGEMNGNKIGANHFVFVVLYYE